MNRIEVQIEIEIFEIPISKIPEPKGFHIPMNRIAVQIQSVEIFEISQKL